MKRSMLYSFAVLIFSFAIMVPAYAETLSKAESSVEIAEKYAGELKWQISFENTKAIKMPDMKLFNATKLAYLQAKKEISLASISEKQKLEKRLEENVGIHYERTMGYIDAVTSGKKIAALTQKFQQQYAEAPIADSTEKTYHELSAEIRKQAKLLYKVYGKTTRDAFLQTYKAPAEKELNNAKYTMSAKGDLTKLHSLIEQKADKKAIEKQVNQLFDSLDIILEDDIYYGLFDEYSLIIRKDTNFADQEKELKNFFATAIELINKEDVDGVFDLYSDEYPEYEYLKEDIKSVFDQFNLKFELLDVHVYSIINGYAYVEVTEKMSEGSDSDIYVSFYLMKKENNVWKYADIFDSY